MIEKMARSHSIEDTMNNFRDLVKPTNKTWQTEPQPEVQVQEGKIPIFPMHDDSVGLRIFIRSRPKQEEIVKTFNKLSSTPSKSLKSY